MSMNLYAVIAADESADCFGGYNKNDRLCTKYCILRLRCAIEQEQKLRSALLDELIESESSIGRIQ